ncbi:MAG: hypothetical protein ACE5JQ_07160 [Candidatus Methylomirabilales bacterium]
MAGLNRSVPEGLLVAPGGLIMGKKADPKQVASVEELLWSMLFEQEALRRVLVRKGIISNEDVFEEIKAVRRDLAGKRGK